MAAYCQVYGVIHFMSPAGWLHVHRDQLRAQRLVTSMGKLYLLGWDSNTELACSSKMSVPDVCFFLHLWVCLSARMSEAKRSNFIDFSKHAICDHLPRFSLSLAMLRYVGGTSAFVHDVVFAPDRPRNKVKQVRSTQSDSSTGSTK